MFSAGAVYEPDDTMFVMRLFYFLHKLKLAGLQRRSITAASTMVSNVQVHIPKYAIRLAIMNLSIDYLVGVKYRDGDEAYFMKEEG
jgi:hypothetical protein